MLQMLPLFGEICIVMSYSVAAYILKKTRASDCYAQLPTVIFVTLLIDCTESYISSSDTGFWGNIEGVSKLSRYVH